MPAIYLFQRKTLLAGDDLQLPAIFTIGFRCTQCFLFVIPMLCQTSADAQRSSVSFFAFLTSDPSQFGPCRSSHMHILLTFLWMCGFLMYAIVSIATECRMYYWSGQGTPTTMGVEMRRVHIQAILQFRLLFSIVALLLLCVLSIAAVSFLRRFAQCRTELEFDDETDENVYVASDLELNDDDINDMEYDRVGSSWWWAAFILLFVSQTIELLLTLTATAILCRRQPRSPDANDSMHDSPSIQSNPSSETYFYQSRNQDNRQGVVEALWADRCQRLFHCLAYSTCFLFGGHDLVGSVNGRHANSSSDNGMGFTVNPYEQVARLLTDYWEAGDVLDITPTDIVAGLLVLQRVQRLGRLQARLDVLQQRINSDQLQRVSSRPTPSTLSVASAPPSPKQTTAGLLRRSNSTGLRSRAPGNTDATVPQTVRVIDPNGTRQHNPSTRSTLYQATHISSRQSIYRRVSVTNLDTIDGAVDGATPLAPYRKESRKILNPAIHANDRRTIQEGARYARHALSIYTWKLYLYTHPMTGSCRLMHACAMCRCRSSSSTTTATAQSPSPAQTASSSPSSSPGTAAHPNLSVPAGSASLRTQQPDAQTLLGHEGSSTPFTIGDNLCQLHKQALVLTAGIDDADLVYAHFVNSCLKMPYSIVLDHAAKSVVLSIRGTLSLEDVVTDTMVDAEPLDPIEFNFADKMNAHPEWPQQYGFSGVVACVRNIYDDLQRHGWLQRLLLGHDAQYPTYSLRLAGHSLGAATAALLSFKLRQDHPDVRVYSYCPPGCTMTWEMAHLAQEWTTSFVLDSDIVPRLSALALEHLRDDTLNLLGRIKVPKYHLAGAVLGSEKHCGVDPSSWCKNANGNRNVASVHEIDAERLQDGVRNLTQRLDATLLDEAPETTTFQRQLRRFLRLQSHVRSSRGAARSMRMYPPGRVVHVIKTGDKRNVCSSIQKCMTCCTSNAGSLYTPVWIANDDLNEIVVSPTMVTDHFVDRICDELEKLAKNMDDSVLAETEHGVADATTSPIDHLGV